MPRPYDPSRPNIAATAAASSGGRPSSGGLRSPMRTRAIRPPAPATPAAVAVAPICRIASNNCAPSPRSPRTARSTSSSSCASVRPAPPRHPLRPLPPSPVPDGRGAGGEGPRHRRQDAPDDRTVGSIQFIEQFQAALTGNNAPNHCDQFAPILRFTHSLQERFQRCRCLGIPLADLRNASNDRLPLFDLGRIPGLLVIACPLPDWRSKTRRLSCSLRRHPRASAPRPRRSAIWANWSTSPRFAAMGRRSLP